MRRVASLTIVLVCVLSVSSCTSTIRFQVEPTNRTLEVPTEGTYYFWIQQETAEREFGPVLIYHFTYRSPEFRAEFQGGEVVIGRLHLPSGRGAGNSTP